jgi:hypothetical protein
MNPCIECKKPTKRSSYKYCSNKCQSLHQYKEYIEKWKQGVVNGSRGVNAKNISRHLKRFLTEKYGEKCSVCGWKKRHLITNSVPLEIDHTDGNSENNDEKNLRLLCPNCHALTPSFRNLNKGNGRKWRKKYIAG